MAPRLWPFTFVDNNSNIFQTNPLKLVVCRVRNVKGQYLKFTLIKLSDFIALQPLHFLFIASPIGTSDINLSTLGSDLCPCDIFSLWSFALQQLIWFCHKNSYYSLYRCYVWLPSSVTVLSISSTIVFYNCCLWLSNVERMITPEMSEKSDLISVLYDKPHIET